MPVMMGTLQTELPGRAMLRRPAPLTSACRPRAPGRPAARLRVCCSSSGASASSGFCSSGDASRGKGLTASWRGGNSGSSGSGSGSAPAAGDSSSTAASQYLQLWSGLGALYSADWLLKSLFSQCGIAFPHALAGMFIITALLMALGDGAAAQVRAFFAPALDWITKWLPLFYVSTLVTLPLAVKGLNGDELTRIFGVLAFGMVSTLIFTAQTTVAIRALVQTPTKEVPKSKPLSPYLPLHFYAWGAVALVSVVVTLASPQGAGVSAALPFGLAFTVLGFLLGNTIPGRYHGILHPVITTGLVANLGAALYGALRGVSYESALKIYCAKGLGPMGAGDLLLSFLGTVILSMGFRIHDQRDTMRRHAPEILITTLLSALFSFVSTALAASALGLHGEVARALIPRSVTVALAMPIAAQLDAPVSITAAAVVVTGLLGANFAPSILNLLRNKDTIARGLSAAATAHGLGTASLVSKEPETLPFCALSYSMVGIFSTLLASIPQVRQMLLAIVG